MELVIYSIMSRLLELLQMHFEAMDDPFHRKTAAPASPALYVGDCELSDDVRKECVQELMKVRLRRSMRALNKNRQERLESKPYLLHRAILSTLDCVLHQAEGLLGMINLGTR